MKISFQNLKKSIQFSLQDDSSVLTRFDQKYGITPSLKKIQFTLKKNKKKKTDIFSSAKSFKKSRSRFRLVLCRKIKSIF